MAKSMTTIKAVFSQLRPSPFYCHRRSISEFMKQHMKAEKEIYDRMDKWAKELSDDIEKNAAERCSELRALIAQQKAFARDVTKNITVSFIAVFGATLAVGYYLPLLVPVNPEVPAEAQETT